MTAPPHEQCARCRQRTPWTKIVKGAIYGFWDGRFLCAACKRFRDKLTEDLRRDAQLQVRHAKTLWRERKRPKR